MNQPAHLPPLVGANMGLGFGWWRRALAIGSVLDNGEGLTMECVLDDKELEWGRRRETREIENQDLVFCIIGFYVLSV